MSSLNLNKYANLAEYYADTRPVGEHNVSYIGNEYVIYDDEEIYDMQGNKIDWNYYLNFYMPNGGTVSLNKTGSPTVVELEYSLDGGATWTVWAEDGSGNRSLTLTAGQLMYVRNTSETQTGFSTSSSDYYQFAFVGSVDAHGNTNSLLCKNAESVTSLSAYCYKYLFYNCSSLVTTPKLPATTLSFDCYHSLFRNCTSLVTFPELPATTLAIECYARMFQGCTSLVSAELPATTLNEYCYTYLFYNCSSLREIHTMMTDVSASHCLDEWLTLVSSQGDFYCPAELTIPTGGYGIPSGWTRHDI